MTNKIIDEAIKRLRKNFVSSPAKGHAIRKIDLDYKGEKYGTHYATLGDIEEIFMSELSTAIQETKKEMMGEFKNMIRDYQCDDGQVMRDELLAALTKENHD